MGGWTLVSRERVPAILSYIYGLTEEHSLVLYDSFVRKYERKPMLIEVKVGLGYKGGDLKLVRASKNNETYVKDGRHINICQTADGAFHAEYVTKEGNGWVYTPLTEEQLKVVVAELHQEV